MEEMEKAPKRPQKHGSVQNIVKNEDIFKSTSQNGPFEEITLSDDDDVPPAKQVKCPTCTRDMTLWTSSRRTTHQNCCKKQREEKAKAKEKTAVVAAKLTKTIEKSKHEKPEPSWEISKDNVQFSRILEDEEANRKRKRARSYSVVRLAPKKCQCEILTTLHEKFMEEFHFKSMKNHAEKEDGVSEHAFQMKRVLEKLARYEQLSSDMQKTLDDTSLPTSDLIVKCKDGELKAPRIIIKHRTNMLKINPKLEAVQVEKEKEVVRVWLTFVFTANIEWNEEHVEDMKELAAKFGPVGLENLLKKKAEKSEKREEVVEKPEELEVKPPEKPEELILQVQEVEEVVEEEEEVNVFTSDDPFIGFGKTTMLSPEIDDDVEMLADDVPSTSSTNQTMDSFDDWSNQSPLRRTKSSPIIKNTPIRDVSDKPPPIFGSNVKIIKTTGITPMPEFDGMDEAELKERMKEIGLRPRGKKIMIKILKDAYNTLHPEICTGTPSIRPLIRSDGVGDIKASQPLRKTLSERLRTPKKLSKVAEDVEMEELDDDDDQCADKTLNTSNDEREVGRICGDDVVGEESDEEEEDVEEKSGKSSSTKDVNLKSDFLKWIRSEENEILFDHVVSLQPVSLEEMLVRLEKAEGPLGRIGKAKLVKLLDSLRITYQLPQKGGTRKFGGAGIRKRFQKK